MSTFSFSSTGRIAFERLQWRATLGGVVAGALLPALLHSLGMEGAIELGAPLGAVIAMLAGLGGRWHQRLLLAGSTGSLMLLAFVCLGWSSFLGPFAVGACASAAIVWGHLMERRRQGLVALGRHSRWTCTVAIASGGLLTWVGTEIGLTLGDALVRTHLSMNGVGAVICGTVALFAALASAPGHMARFESPLLWRLRRACEAAPNDLARLLDRLAERFELCGASLAQLPETRERKRLVGALTDLAKDATIGAERWLSLQPLVDRVNLPEMDEEIGRLRKLADSSPDAWSARQHVSAASALAESRDEAVTLGLRRDRTLARLELDLALLDSARMSLLGTLGGRAQLGSTEVGQLAQRFSRLLEREQTEAIVSDARLAESVPEAG